MNLADGDQGRGRISAEGLGQQPAIPGYRFPVVVCRNAKI
jgi:hypothetical protein